MYKSSRWKKSLRERNKGRERALKLGLSCISGMGGWVTEPEIEFY